MNIINHNSNGKNSNGARLRTSIAENRLAGTLVGVFTFAVMALMTYVLSSMLGGAVWFSIILGVAIGALSFCAMRIWIDENGFDSPDTNAYVIMAGTLSFIGIMLAYITMNMYPFGDHTVLIIDMHHQYVAFYSLLRDKLLHGGSLLYSDSLGLGAGFLPLWAYYVASPFSLITLLFPREMITEALLLITVLKVTAGGVTFSIFARRKFGRNDFSIVIGGVAFALMSFMVGHAWNLMWLDPIILLPLIVLGLEKLLREGKPLLYCVTLAMALICNYYIGYMICVFLVFYFLAYVISEKNETERPALSSSFWKSYRIALAVLAVFCLGGIVYSVITEKYILIPTALAVLLIASSYFISLRFWRFCYGSILGGGLSAVVVVPTFLALMTTSGADDSFSRDLATNFSFFQLFPRTLFSAAPSMRGDSLPNIYCSVLVLVLMVMYLTCSAIPLRKRLAWGGVVGIVGFAMSLNWLNFAWHGFHFPNDLPYRFSFLMSFAMICVAMQMLDKIDSLTPCGVCISAVIVAALIFIEQQFGSEADFVMFFVSLIAVIVYSVIVGLRSAGLMKNALCYALLAVLVFGEVAANASVELKKLDSREYYTERESFVGDYTADSRAFELIDSYKAESAGEMMYREELLPRKTCNDPSLFGYDGITVFASSNRRSVTTLMGKLGFAVNGVNSYLYKCYVPVCDSILGLKYVVLGNAIGGHQQLVSVGSVSDDAYLSRYVYANTAALSKAFMVSRSVVYWEWDQMNPFAVQNSLLSCAAGSRDVYDMVYLQNSGMTYDETTGEYVDAGSGTSVSEFNCTVNISGTYFTCSRVSEALTANFTASQTVEEDGQMYAYVDCRAASSINVSVPSASGEIQNFSVSPNEPFVVDLGYVYAGTDVSVTIYTDMSCGGNIFLAKLNNEAFNEAINTLKANNLNVSKYKEGHIVGEIDSPYDGMMFTSIPYDSGWTVKVDGKKVSTYALGEALLIFEVPAGKHTVEMSYFPEGAVIGLVITLICLAVFILLVNDKTRGWVKAGIPSGFFADDGVDHQFEDKGPSGADENPEDTVVDYISSDEGFEQVDISSLDAVVREPHISHRSAQRSADRRMPDAPQEGSAERGGSSGEQLPKGFEHFFEDE